MSRMICTLLLLGTFVIAAPAQSKAEVSPLDRTQSPPSAVYVPESAIRSSNEPRTFEELKLGVMAPDFAMNGSGGQLVRLADLKGRWAVLVFTQNRSTLAPLKNIDGELRRAGVSLYGVCRDAAPKLAAWAEHGQIPFVLLSDRTREVSEAYRRYDADYDLIRPGIVLLDPQGMVRMTLPGRSPQPGDVLKRVLHVVTGA